MTNNPAKPFFGESRRIFTASMLAHVMYILIAAGLASKFFAEFHPWLKIGIFVVIISFAVISILLYPSVKSEKEER